VKSNATPARDDICRRTRGSNVGDTMQIADHFTLEELSFSEVAVRRGIDNTPPTVVIVNLSLVAAVMERIRTLLGDRPIVVHSGYRSAEVNRAVGGVATSAHCRGLACDFVCPAFGSPAEAALVILKSDIDYDQLILEYGWVHIGLAQEGALSRREALTKRSPFTPDETGIKG
jgi:zinc D-Ala-D-Ala carboxypeptidase